MPRGFVFIVLSIIFFCMAIPLPLPFDFDNIVIILFLCLDVYLIFIKKKTPNHAFVIWNVIFILFCVLSIFWSISPHLSIIQVRVRMMANLLMGVFLTTYTNSYKNLKTVFLAFYVSSVVFLVYMASIVDLSSLDEGRVVGAIVDDNIAEKLNANYIAGRLVLALYVGFYLFWRLRKTVRYVKIFHILFSLSVVYVVLISGSRTSLFVLLIPPMLHIFYKARHLIPALIYISIGTYIVYLVVIKIPFFYDIIGFRIEDAVNVITGNESGHEDASRLMLINYGIDWFSDKPILGYGINCFKELADITMLFSTRGKYGHNNYIELLVDIGLVGTFLYYSIYFFFVKNIKCLKGKPSSVTLKLLIVLMLFTDFFWVGYYNRLSQLLVWLTFIIISLEKTNQKVYNRIEYEKS